MAYIFNWGLSYGKCFIDFTLFFWFSCQFLTYKQEKHNKFPYFLLAVLAFLLFTINSLQIPQLNTLATLFCALAINLFLFQASLAALLLCSISEVLLIIVCEFIPISVYTLIFQKNLATVTYQNIGNSAFNLISTGIFCIFIIMMRHFIIILRQKDSNIGIKENFSIIVVPLTSIFIIYYILDICSFNTCMDGDGTAYQQSIFIFAGIFIMNVVAIIGDTNTRKQYYLQRELDRLNRLEEQNRIVISQQDQFIEELKGLAHDHIKQINGIQDMLNLTQTDHLLGSEIQSYLDELHGSISENYLFAFIPTPALRVILSQVQIRCNTEGIGFEANIQYADFSFISFPDIYTIFENPLSNAIEACIASQSACQKEIKLTMIKKNGLAWISISNPKTTPVVVKNNMFQTTKTDSQWHGLGIRNMKRAVENYGGHLNINYTSDTFMVTIALPIPQKP